MCVPPLRGLELSPYTYEVTFIDPHVSSIPIYVVILSLTFFELLQIFSKKINSRKFDFDHSRYNPHYTEVVRPIKISCFNS